MIAANVRYGLALRESPQVVLEANAIQDNGSYGVGLYESPYFSTEEKFSGQVVGRGNPGGRERERRHVPRAELGYRFP